jgi:hypothetical protein
MNRRKYGGIRLAFHPQFSGSSDGHIRAERVATRVFAIQFACDLPASNIADSDRDPSKAPPIQPRAHTVSWMGPSTTLGRTMRAVATTDVRSISNVEWRALDAMLLVEFEGVETQRAQAAAVASVRTSCGCGCGSIA